MSETIYLGIDPVPAVPPSPPPTVSAKRFGLTLVIQKTTLQKKMVVDIIYGKEAVDNRMSLNLFRLAGGSIKAKGSEDSTEPKAVRDLLNT